MVIFKKSKIMNSLIIATIIVLMSNCKKDKILKDDELSIKKTQYVGIELRTDGYYYYEYDNMISIYFLNKDGVFLLGGSFEKKLLSERENRFSNGEYYQAVKDIKTAWGVFLISNNEIKIERWQPLNAINKVYLHKGKILNDTTFYITNIYHNQEEISNFVQSFNFRQFSPKPDSTNIFIP